jgi:hypothetical protein
LELVARSLRTKTLDLLIRIPEAVFPLPNPSKCAVRLINPTTTLATITSANG